MPRYGPFIHQVYIADGFADDCDELIHRCLKAENFDYHVFCTIWKEMNMGCLYEGRTLGAEIAELSEEVIHIGKHYMLKDTSNFEETVVGVFIMYALLHLQPYKGFAHLRIVPQDLPAINRIEHVARRDKRYDVLYALGSILIKGPVQYHAAEREYGMDLAVRKYIEGFTSIDKLGVRPKGVFRRQNEELDVLKDIHCMLQSYSRAKSMISEKSRHDRNLKYINANLAKELEIGLLKLITGVVEDRYGNLGESSHSESEPSYSRQAIKEKAMEPSYSRQAIKDKAMKQNVNPVKHLMDVRDRRTKNTTSVSPKKDESRTSAKKKSRKVKKDTYDAKERKRRIPISPRAIKKFRIKTKSMHVKESSSSECDESDSSESDPAKSDDKSNSTSLPAEVEVANVDTKANEKDKEAAEKNDEVNEQELDIQIDTLPVIIRTEDQGKLFEIEIIDQKEAATELEKNSPMVKKPQKKESALKKIKSMPGVSIKKIGHPEATEPIPSTSTANPYATIIAVHKDKNEQNIGKPKTGDNKLGIVVTKEKRDCKRVHLQSKFKRLGMLPVANFKTDEVIAVEEPEDTDTDAESEPRGDLGMPLIDD